MIHRIALFLGLLICMTLPARAQEPPTVYLIGGTDGGESVKRGMEELYEYLPRITTSSVQATALEAWKADVKKPAIVVGVGPDGAAPQDWGRDAYRLLSQDGVLYLYGVDGPASNGSLYAVYDYLRSVYGVRWVFPGPAGEVVPAQKTALKIDGLDRRQAPGFEQRILGDGIWPGLNMEIKSHIGVTEPEEKQIRRLQRQWIFRNRLQTNKIIEGGHAFGSWWEKYHEQHPDWFAMHRNGKRVLNGKPGRVKICTTNPEVIEQAVQQGVERLDGNPASMSISGSPNDSALSNWCMCDACKALDVPEAPKIQISDITGSFEYVSLSDRHVAFWNAMAARLQELRPGKKVAAYAYYATSAPPLKQRLHPQVLIGFVQHAAAYWDQRTWEEERHNFDGWADMGGKGYWRPNSLLIGHGIPSNYLPRLADDIRHIHERGTQYVYYDSMVPHWGTMGHLYNVLAEMLWNPKADYQTVLSDYLQSAYGPAAGDVKAYLDRLAVLTETMYASKLVDGDLWRASGEMGPAKFYTASEVEALQASLSRAAQAAAGQPAAARVALLQEGFDFAKLQLAVNRELYLTPGELNFKSGPLAQAIAARDQWLKEHRQSLAISAPAIYTMAQTMQGIAPRVRSKIDQLLDQKGE